MIKHYPYDSLGKADHGWLKSRHHFSFANYYNPRRMGFGALRVVNDDRVEPGTGFPPHPHKNMEIISYIRSGAVNHEDSVGNRGVTAAGEVQVMSAGTGIVHSEYNRTQSALTFYQIWIETNHEAAEPRWDSMPFPTAPVENQLPLLVSGFAEDEGKALFIHQDARVYGGRIRQGDEIEHIITQQAYVLASDGSFEITSQTPAAQLLMGKGDGAEVTKTGVIRLRAITDSEVVIIET
jgi:redox-sensitive bicupin YhaK (pirin superfamily)